MKITKLILGVAVFSILTACSSTSMITNSSDKTKNTSQFAVYDEPPKAVKRVPPVYPTFAKKMKIEGDVIINVEVLANGKVKDVKVIKSLMSGPGGLDESAVKAVKQWEFVPAKSKGEPVNCWITFPISFRLN